MHVSAGSSRLSQHNAYVCGFLKGFSIMSTQKQQLLKRFKPLSDSFSVVSLYIFELTYLLLELPFHVELNGLCPNSVY